MNDEQDIAAGAAALLNTSGIDPIEYKVLVRPDTVENRTKRGIELPDETVDARRRAVSIGTLVAASPYAFNFEAGMEPVIPGTRVLYAKYAGGEIKGPADGITYRVMSDKDILGIIVREGSPDADEAPILHLAGAGMAA